MSIQKIEYTDKLKTGTDKINLNFEFIIGKAKSAYELWIEQGNTGTIADFLNSLKATIENSQINYLMTDFLTVGKNLFNVNDVSMNTLISSTNGTRVTSNNYVSSRILIPVEPNTQYTQNYSGVIAFKDSKGNFISGLAMASPANVSRTFTTPSNAKFIETTYYNIGISGQTTDYRTYQIEKGTSVTPYENFKYMLKYIDVALQSNSVSTGQISDKAVTPQKLSFFVTSTNLFNKAKATTGYYVNQTNGAINANASYSASDYISIKPSMTYTKSNTLQYYAFYDANKTFISNAATSTNSITSPSNASYVRVTCLTSNLDTFMLVEGSTIPSTYQKFEEYIDPGVLKQSTTQSDSFGKSTMKKFNAQVAKLQSGQDVRIEGILIGDSWTDYEPRFAKPLRDKLKVLYGDGGIGFIGLANNHYGNGSVVVGNFTGTWKQYDAPTDSTVTKGIDTAMLESTTANSTCMINITEDSDYIEVHFLQQSGTWRYNIDGGEWKTVDSSTTNKIVENMSLGLHKFNIEHLTGTTTFVGAVSYKGNKGSVVHCVGNSGLKASDIVASDRTNWIEQFAKLNVQYANIMFGTNDMSANVPLDTFKSQLKEIISRVREAKPGIDVTLCSPSGNNLTGKTYTMKDYDIATRQVAEEVNCAFVSLYDNLGDFATANANGLMQSDGIHPNEIGGFVIANTYYDRLLRI
ncbi:SGNH/GDSL hydrolase family protein [Macrococcus capreoli]|uniref:SGNH/GDSL hydrolase family protein n=1 Tax=Macrococcus capreoli TaxID=2982690 RepID=UPI003F42391E